MPTADRTIAPGALVRMTNVMVARVSCESEGFSLLVDQAPIAGPTSPPPGTIVVAPSARRAAGTLRRQLIGAANTSLNSTTNPTADSSSSTPAATIQWPQPSTSRAGTPASAGRARNTAATNTKSAAPQSDQRRKCRSAARGGLGVWPGIG